MVQDKTMHAMGMYSRRFIDESFYYKHRYAN